MCKALMAFGLISATLATLVTPAHAQPAAEFYKDKRVEFLISSTVGGGNDISARMVTRHIAPHMPGAPVFIAKNMPGAGGVTLANHLFNVAPRDGLSLGMVQNSALFQPLYGDVKARFDIKKFNWLGSPNKDVGVLILWHQVPVDSIDDARKKGLILGVSGGLNATPAFYARVLAKVFDLNIRMVAGYPGQSEAFIAMERGENEGYPSAFWSSLKAVKPGWIAEKQIKMLLHFGQAPHAELSSVPFADHLLKNSPENRAIMAVASAPLAVGRPIVAPPDVPADRVAALRKALDATFRSQGYLAECAKLNLECADPTTGGELEKIMLDAYDAPAHIVKQIRDLNESN